MKARFIRLLFATHRWTGVLLGLLMLVWCLSGFVMLYSPYPSTSIDGRDYRVEGLERLVAPHGGWVFPGADGPADEDTLASLRVEMLADRPVMQLAWDGGRGVFDLATGARISGVGEDQAIAIATTYARQHSIDAAPAIKKLSERDEFSVAGYLNDGRPYWQVPLNDSDGTMLYVASTTGEIRQRTTESLRFWGWLGAIPHWLYFTELRKNGPLWTDVIIWTSLGGCFLTVLGLFVGLRQLRRRKSTGKLASPYTGAKFWHHMLGLVFGVLVLTWTFSGFVSMQPWGWLETGDEARAAASRLPGDTVKWGDAKEGLAAQLAGLGPSTKQIVSTPFAGRMFFTTLDDAGQRERRDMAGMPAPFDASAWSEAATLLSGGKFATEVELMHREDAYYYRGAAASNLPVVKITIPEMDNTSFYIDHVTGQARAIADPGSKGFRWLHLGLHRIDFTSWLRIRPVKDIVIWILMLGVTAVCALGAWMGLRKLARGGQLDNTPSAQARAARRRSDHSSG